MPGISAPVTIRNHNPGAMWNGRASRKFGSGTYERLSDGNRAATFPSSIHGAAALFYLLDTSRHYRGRSIAEAIATWSGGNHVNAYLNTIEARSKHKRGDFIDDDLINDPSEAISLARAMAFHETGHEYPLSAAEWRKAYDLFQSVRSGERVTTVEKVGPRTNALAWALDHLGQREIPGPEHNTFVVDCFAAVGRPEIQDDETAWCAAFLGAALKASGYAYLPGALTARSYLDYGVPVDEPEVGAICVMWRDNPRSWKGHVAFVESWTPTTVTLVGGNQDDAVTRMTVSRTGRKSQVLGYRRPLPAKTPMGEVLSSDSVKYKSAGLFAILATMFWSVGEWIGESSALIWSMIVSLWTDAPQVATAVSGQVHAFNQLSVHMQLPWPAYVSLAIAAAAIGANLYSTWRRKRNRQDDDTQPVMRAG